MKNTVIIYGISLAVIAFVLKTIEYKWLMRDLSWQIYGLLIAIIFGLLGAFLAHKLLNHQKVNEPFERNDQAITSLGLSKRELQVLEEICKGHSNKKIAQSLYISINTVKTHLKNAYDKLEVNNRILAIEKLKSLNIIER